MYYFAFTYGSLAILVIDTEEPYAKGSKQYEYIKRDLERFSKKYWIAAIFHRPAYSSGVGHGGEESPKIAEDLVPLFERYGVDWVIHGHDHIYERSFKDGVTYIVAGGGGATPAFGGVTPNPYKIVTKSFTFCYTLLDLTPSGYSLKTFTPKGKKIDEVVVDESRPQIFILQPAGSIEKLTENGKYKLTGPIEAFTAKRGSIYRIYFNAKDRDSDARISIYLDRNTTGEDGILIGSGISEDHCRYFDWEVPPGFPAGKYYIYGRIQDGQHEMVDYSKFTICVK